MGFLVTDYSIPPTVEFVAGFVLGICIYQLVCAHLFWCFGTQYITFNALTVGARLRRLLTVCLFLQLRSTVISSAP